MRQMTVSNFAVPGLGRQTLSSQASINGNRGRYSASKSLDLVRMNIQSLINRDIDALLRKYLDKFFQPAIVNIRRNLGDHSVSEDQILQVCLQILDDAKLQYGGRTPSSVGNSPISDNECALPDTRVPIPPLQQPMSTPVPKRRESENEVDSAVKARKKILRTVTSVIPGTPTPIKVVKLEGIKRDGPKWDPARITRSTLFIMGARANKVLGFGQTRGRLYTKHPELLKYSGDTEDKEWLSRNNLMPPTGGIAYLLLLEDVRELAESDDYRHNPNVLLYELKGFEAPEFMLSKIRRFVANARTDGQEDLAFHFCDSISRCGADTSYTPTATSTSYDEDIVNGHKSLRDTLMINLAKYNPNQPVFEQMYLTSTGNQTYGGAFQF